MGYWWASSTPEEKIKIMYDLVFYLNLYSTVWSESSDRGLEDWQVGWNNWEIATIMPIIGCILPLPVPFLSASVSVYRKITIMQQAGKHQPMHIFVFFFLSLVILSFWSAFVWGETCCSGRTIALASLGPVGGCLCSHVDVLYRTSGSIRLSVLNNSKHFWENPHINPPPPPQPWLDWDSPKTARHQLARMWQFSPLGNSLAK